MVTASIHLSRYIPSYQTDLHWESGRVCLYYEATRCTFLSHTVHFLFLLLITTSICIDYHEQIVNSPGSLMLRCGTFWITHSLSHTHPVHTHTHYISRDLNINFLTPSLPHTFRLSIVALLLTSAHRIIYWQYLEWQIQLILLIIDG